MDGFEKINELFDREYDDLLRGSGFLPLPQMEDCYVTDMRRPLVLFFDTPSFIKDQFSEFNTF